jgi:NitT/TauT family transport system ATP-binding protein
MILPRVSTNSFAGLLEALAAAPCLGKAELPELAGTLQLEIDQLFPVAETLQLLRFAEVDSGEIRLTTAGRKFAEAAVDARKKMFGDHLLAYVPLAARVRRVLDERANHQAPAQRFMQELEDYMSDDAAETTLRTVTNWGRYGELFAYDETAQVFSLENPQ